MNKKIILTSIIAMYMACPTYADIGKNESNPSCDQSTIGATTGTTDLEAEWDPNTINMEWYVDGSKITPNNPAANTCTYDTNVTLPTNTLSKTGYTFVGWRVKPFSLSGLDTSINGFDIGCITAHSDKADQADEYGLTADNTWATGFSYGTVYGEASCQATLDADMAYYLTNADALLNGTMPAEDFFAGYANVAGAAKAATLQDIFTRYSNGQITYDEAEGEVRAKLLSSNDSKYTTTSTGQYCFCRATGYTPLNGTRQSVASPAWVFFGNKGYDSADDCARNCAVNCASHVRDSSGLRGALFGSSN